MNAPERSSAFLLDEDSGEVKCVYTADTKVRTQMERLRLNCCNINAKKCCFVLFCFVFFSFRSRMLEPSVLTKKITLQQTCCECSCSEILRFDLQDTTTLILWSITSTSRFRRITPQLLLLRSYHPLLRIFPTRQIT